MAGQRLSPARPLHLRLSDIDRVVTPTLVALLAFGVIAPLAFLLYGALTTVPIGRPFTGFSLRNFIAVGSESVYLRAFLNTLIVGTASTLLAAIIGIALAWVVARTDAPARGALRVGVMVPFFLSPFIDRKSTRLNSSHSQQSRMPSSA